MCMFDDLDIIVFIIRGESRWNRSGDVTKARSLGRQSQGPRHTQGTMMKDDSTTGTRDRMRECD